MRFWPIAQADPVDRAQRTAWERDGFLVLPGFFEATRLDAVDGLVASLDDPHTRPPELADRLTIDVLHGALNGRRMRLRDAPAGTFSGPVKLNDLYLESEAVRACSLDARLVRVLAVLLGGAPAVCNSLNFLAGSEQPAHIDTWYMPGPGAGGLIVTSICLEDVRPDAGPVFYYPGSHHIRPYRFSHGGLAAVDAEMPDCHAYVQREIAWRGLRRDVFLGRRGDVLIWSAQLVHGGSPITRPGATRRSLVTHYWRQADMRGFKVEREGAAGYFLRREHQPVPVA